MMEEEDPDRIETTCVLCNLKIIADKQELIPMCNRCKYIELFQDDYS